MSKKAFLAAEKLIIIILIAFVIIIFFGFLFYGNPIMGWLRALPGYNYPEEEIEINVDLNEIPTTGCDFNHIAGFVGKVEGNKLQQIFSSLSNGQQIYILTDREKKSVEASNIYIKGEDEDNAELYYNIVNFGEIKIGSINNEKISILSEFFDLNSEFFQKARINDLIGLNKLNIYPETLVQYFARLHESVYNSGVLCKTDEDMAKETSLIKPINSPGEDIMLNFDLSFGLVDKWFKDKYYEAKLPKEIINSKEEYMRDARISKKGKVLVVHTSGFYYKNDFHIPVISENRNPLMIILSDGSAWLWTVETEINFFSDSVKVKDNSFIKLRDVSFTSSTTYNLQKDRPFVYEYYSVDKPNSGDILDWQYFAESNIKMSQEDFNYLIETLK